MLWLVFKALEELTVLGRHPGVAGAPDFGTFTPGFGMAPSKV